MYADIMKFSASHEWLILEDEHTGIVGISHYAQDLLGDVVYIELPAIGQHVTAQQTIGVIESAKAASDLYTPVSGEIIDVNQELSNEPAIVNQDPHASGWLFKIRLSQPAEVTQLLSATDYQQLIGSSAS